MSCMENISFFTGVLTRLRLKNEYVESPYRHCELMNCVDLHL